MNLNLFLFFLIAKSEIPENWPAKGGLKFKGVCARYSQKGETILKDVSFEIPPGNKKFYFFFISPFLLISLRILTLIF